MVVIAACTLLLFNARLVVCNVENRGSRSEEIGSRKAKGGLWRADRTEASLGSKSQGPERMSDKKYLTLALDTDAPSDVRRTWRRVCHWLKRDGRQRGQLMDDCISRARAAGRDDIRLLDRREDGLCEVGERRQLRFTALSWKPPPEGLVCHGDFVWFSLCEGDEEWGGENLLVVAKHLSAAASAAIGHCHYTCVHARVCGAPIRPDNDEGG